LEKTEQGIIILLTNIFNKSDIDTINKNDALKRLNNIIDEYKRNKKP